jgi:hypothetical protein
MKATVIVKEAADGDAIQAPANPVLATETGLVVPT